MDKQQIEKLPPEANTATGVIPDSGAAPDTGELRNYTQTKLFLAGQLRIVREGLQAMDLKDAERECEDLIVKLAEDRFTLAVLGQFKRGKSSLMNAIIGRDILPTGVLPLTSAITVLKYGPEERLMVTYDYSPFRKACLVADLAGYVTEKGNPGNEKKVKKVDVELPLPFLRYGLHFVDTPGVGSVIQSNTATTYNFLPECDAVIFVTGIDTPLTSVELDFLRDIGSYANRIFFVLNKIDLVNDAEKDELLGFVNETISRQTGTSNNRIFPVSARRAMEAGISGDTHLYQTSGIKQLEDALATFLTTEKSDVFLSAVVQRASRLLNEEIARNKFSDNRIAARVSELKNEEVVTVHQNPYEAVAALLAAKSKIEKLEGVIRGAKTLETVIGEEPSVSKPAAAADIITGPHNGHAPAPDLTAEMNSALREGRCPVCAHITETAMEFFAHWQYEIATKEDAQKAFAGELGFCPLHTWQLVSMSSPYGASIGFVPLAEKMAGLIKEIAASPEKNENLDHLIHNSGNCRVCALLRDAENDAVSELIKIVDTPEGLRRYGLSEGVCIRHLRMVLKKIHSAETRTFLLRHLTTRFEHDAEDMRSYTMKHDARHRDLENKEEEGAWHRAIVSMAGEKSVCSPWPEDGEI